MKSVAKYRQLAEEYRKLSDKLVNPKDKKECEDRLTSKAVRELLDRICQETVG